MESEIGRGPQDEGSSGFNAPWTSIPRFAAAYSGLADCYAALGYLSYISPAEAFPAARRHATKALELDPSLAEPHASLGFVKLYFEWDWSGAEAEFRRAIALDPNYAATHQWYSIYLLAAGRASEAFREIQLARQRDPLSLPDQFGPRLLLLLHRPIRRGGKAVEIRVGDEQGLSAGASLVGPNLPRARKVRRRTRRISAGRGKGPAVARIDCGARICRRSGRPHR